MWCIIFHCKCVNRVMQYWQVYSSSVIGVYEYVILLCVVVVVVFIIESVCFFVKHTSNNDYYIKDTYVLQKCRTYICTSIVRTCFFRDLALTYINEYYMNDTDVLQKHGTQICTSIICTCFYRDLALTFINIYYILGKNAARRFVPASSVRVFPGTSLSNFCGIHTFDHHPQYLVIAEQSLH